MPDKGVNQNPSLDDILASIRRILTEDEAEQGGVQIDRGSRDNLELNELRGDPDEDPIKPPDGSGTRVLNQDEIDHLLGFDDEYDPVPTADEALRFLRLCLVGDGPGIGPLPFIHWFQMAAAESLEVLQRIQDGKVGPEDVPSEQAAILRRLLKRLVQ